MVTNVFKGKILEYLVKSIYRKKGYLTFRLAGSRPYDILAIGKSCTIYLYICENFDDANGVIDLLEENSYIIVRQTGRSEYIAIKTQIIILIMIKDLLDERVLYEIDKLNIKTIKISSIRGFLKEKKERCFDILPIEVKPDLYKYEEQFQDQLIISRVYDTSLVYVHKVNNELYEYYYYSTGQRFLIQKLK